MKDILATLTPGDQIELGKMFPGMSGEKIVWTLTGVQEYKTRSPLYKFTLHWYGVKVGKMNVQANKEGEIIMREVG